MKRRWNSVGAAALGLAMLTLVVPLPLTGKRAEPAERLFACSPAARSANLAFTLKDLDNVDVTLSVFKGKVILLNFWATWCKPCKVETPWFIDLQTRYGKEGLQVIGISIDDPLALLKPYAAEYKMSYPVLQGLGHEDLLAAFGPFRGVPTTFIISREGKLCAKHIGVTARDGFETQIKGLL
jgi:cytochrome c biogenesis protein CcmG/thiol:disulfide interchange protein DsbE